MEKLNKRAVGARNEELACRYLMEQGVRILDRNFRCKIGEIDIIGIDKGTYVFFEVKYRRNNINGMPYEAVNYYKQKTISRVAYFYKTIKKLPDNGSFRFDIISILGDEITWFKNAFQFIN